MGAFFEELIHAGIYKSSQGRIARQLTFAAIVATLAVGFYRMGSLLNVSEWAGSAPGIQYWLPALLLAASVWVCYRLVNFPIFADFLISVEAEMNKVSWPTRAELVRASVVVLVMLIFMALLLAAYDLFWRGVFMLLNLF